MAPVPLYRPQPIGYAGFTSNIDGSISQGVWSCGCGPRPGDRPYGDKMAENAIIDPTRAYYSELNCSGTPTTCLDPAALTYNANGQPAEHLSCTYATALSRVECQEARTPDTGCFRYPFRLSN